MSHLGVLVKIGRTMPTVSDKSRVQQLDTNRLCSIRGHYFTISLSNGMEKLRRDVLQFDFKIHEALLVHVKR